MKRPDFFIVAAMSIAVSGVAQASDFAPQAKARTGEPVSLDRIPSVLPDASSAPPLSISSVTIGFPVAGYPCYSCVANYAVGIPFPLTVMPNGSPYTVTIQLDDDTYSGSPIVFFSLIQNGAAVGSGHVTIPAFTGNQVNFAQFDGTLPATSGSATIVAKVYSGSTLVAKGGLNIFIK